MEQKLDGNYARRLRAVLNKSCKQHPTELRLYGHLPPISQTIPEWWGKHAVHCWRSKNELMRDILQETYAHKHVSVGRPETYIHLSQLCADNEYRLEDLASARADINEERERERERFKIQMAWWWCPWCNSYHRRKWTRRHEFKSWTRLIAFHIALIPLGKVWIQLFSLQLWLNSRTD